MIKKRVAIKQNYSSYKHNAERKTLTLFCFSSTGQPDPDQGGHASARTVRFWCIELADFGYMLYMHPFKSRLVFSETKSS